MPGASQTVLRQLARAAGVADEYEAASQLRRPPASTLRAVLTELGHPCNDEDTAAESLRALRMRPWLRPLDPVVIGWHDATDAPRATLSAAQSAVPRLSLTLEDGTTRTLPAVVWGGWRVCEGEQRVRGSIQLPADLPLGYHHLTMDDGQQETVCTVIVAPARCPSPGPERRWGWMAQLYAVRSCASWGQGEFRDLRKLATWSATQGADFILINPVHAMAPVLPQEASPYSPTSRRFINPNYLHVPDLPEYRALSDERQRALATLPAALAPDSDRIDRDAVWQHKRAVLAELFAGMDDVERRRLDEYRRQQGPSLERFATFCALAEAHGLPFDDWPEGLRDPRSPQVAQWAHAHPDAVALHAWLQLCCRQQMAAAQDAARSAGMSIGVINDLAVGVERDGADAWALPGQIARRMSVGAPPDAFNQQGQNWGQPPLLPDALRETGFQTLRELLQASMSDGGGLRIDHILGLSRLFWIPQDADAADGTYVRYPVEEQFAVLALEAHRTGAIVIGEDLGTVDDRIRTLMRRHGVLSSAVLYFERQREQRRPARAYPRAALASVTTHDLPTATGLWDGSALEVRAELHLLDQELDAARTALEDEQRCLLDLLRASGCLTTGMPDVRECVLAMHRFLASTPTVLVAGALWDALGDARQPNVPGTVDSYPNWRLPLARPTPSGTQPITLDAVRSSREVHEAVLALRRKR